MDRNHGSFTLSASGVIDMIDTIDRPPDGDANLAYARSGSYSHPGGINKPNERIPRTGAYAEMGVGEIYGECSVFAAGAKGPNASAGVEASPTGVKAMTTAGLGTVNASAGPANVEVGLKFDTGVTAGVDGFELKVLGTGFKIGPNFNISVPFLEAGFDFW